MLVYPEPLFSAFIVSLKFTLQKGDRKDDGCILMSRLLQLNYGFFLQNKCNQN